MLPGITLHDASMSYQRYCSIVACGEGTMYQPGYRVYILKLVWMRVPTIPKLTGREVVLFSSSVCWPSRA